jgi:DNA-binding response OmpR family regulator
MRILVVEDELKMASLLRRGLVEEGHAVDVARTGDDAIWMAAAVEYDAIVLDLMLPGVDGIEACRRMRENGVWSPVLMLTARDAVGDRVEGLDAGADDYLTNPFALAELLARVRALLRRDAGGGSAMLEVGDLVLDTARQDARRRDRQLPLTRKEFGVLEYLMTRPGHVVSAEELLDHVWDENADPFTQTVRVTVGTLRRKLTVDGEEPLLETVIGRGYRLRETAP